MTSLFSSDVSSLKNLHFESRRLTKKEAAILMASVDKLNVIIKTYHEVKKSVDFATIDNSDENKSAAKRLAALEPYGKAAIASLAAAKKTRNTIMSSTGDVNASIMECNEIIMKTIYEMKENLKL